jgi:hypothetical protein
MDEPVRHRLLSSPLRFAIGTRVAAGVSIKESKQTECQKLHRIQIGLIAYARERPCRQA